MRASADVFDVVKARQMFLDFWVLAAVTDCVPLLRDWDPRAASEGRFLRALLRDHGEKQTSPFRLPEGLSANIVGYSVYIS